MEKQTDIDISLCLPSRGRPELAKRFVDSAIKKSSNSNSIEFLFYLNDDDPKLEEYKKILDKKNYIVGPNQSTAYSWNQMAYKSVGHIVMLAGDDVEFKTENWDTEIKNTFNLHDDKICMVVPWDGKKGKEKFVSQKSKYVYVGDEPLGAPHFFVHRKWIDTLGWLAPPFFWHWFVDTYTQKLARKIGRCIFLPGVICKASKIFDDTAVNVRKHLNINQRDDFVWSMVRDRYLKTDVDLLKQSIKGS